MHDVFPIPTTTALSPDQLLFAWKQISEDLRAELGASTFDLWFSDFLLHSVGPEGAVLLAPGSMYSIWVEENFKDSVISTFQKYLEPCERVIFNLATADQLAEAREGSDKKSNKGPAEKDVTKLKQKVMSETISEEKLLERGRAAGLVETFLFKDFVPGENCDLAWAAAQAVAETPGRTYQPLFFHSASGLGKTHLLHGIGWETLRRRPKSKIIFVTAEQFANDYIEGIQKNSLGTFRKKYREADLLLIDDVQFLGRKEGLQQEFFHTFNRLSDLRKQIVLASDCPASEINELEDRLVSRFQWGLSAEIHRPGVETRAAILRHKRTGWNMQVSDELIEAIVERVRGNVRVLEGALIRVAMVSTMNEKEISPSDVAEIISDICDTVESSQVSMREIKEVVAEHYDLQVKDIDGKKRTARVAEARQVAMFLIRNLTDHSLVEIASSFGKDHGTVIYAVKKIKAKCETSPSLKSTIELIKRKLVRFGSGSRSGKSGQRSEGKKKWLKNDSDAPSGRLGSSGLLGSDGG